MPAYAFECPDVIEDAGKDTAVHYKIQKFSWSKFKCERSGGIRKEGLPLYQGAERCPRVKLGLGRAAISPAMSSAS